MKKRLCRLAMANLSLSLLSLSLSTFGETGVVAARQRDDTSIFRGQFQISQERKSFKYEMRRFQSFVTQAALVHGASSKRWFSIYDQINVLDKVAEDSGRLRFTGYSDAGFDVNNAFHEGSVICHGSLLLKWTPLTFKEITPESLSLFQLLRPAPDLLLLGCGRRMQLVGKDVREFLRSNGIKLEAIDSRNAVSTFNFLNEEGRLVAAALLPYGSEA